jgi:hypothetical protein
MLLRNAWKSVSWTQPQREDVAASQQASKHFPAMT